MVDPAVMCNQHLLGEHVELHMVVGCLTKGYENTVYALARMGLLETDRVEERHAVLVAEMVRRGMNHQSPLLYTDQLHMGTVDVEQSLWELYRRCRECRQRQREILGQICTDCPGGLMCCITRHASVEEERA